MLRFLALLLTTTALAASPLDQYPALMDTLVGGHHAAASEICAILEQQHPEHPGTLYARAAVLYAFMLDLEDTTGRGEFMNLTERCIRASGEWLKARRGLPSEMAFLRGSARSARGLLLHHEGKLLPGLRQLMGAKGDFDEAIEADPGFYDAYLGRGAYRYAVARNAKAIGWLPFMPRAEAGWRDLWDAVHRARFSRWSALSAIVWFAIEDNNFALADSICQAGLARFPGSRSFLFPALGLAVRREQWAEAEQLAQQLLGQYLQHPANNGYEAIGLYWRLMQCADRLGRPADAEAYARAGLEAHRTADVEERRRDRLGEMEQRLARAAEPNR